MEKNTKTEKTTMAGVKINPLRNEKIFVRLIPRSVGYVGSDKKHVLSGGMGNGVVHSYCVPVVGSTGNFKNVLTNAEKDFLEDILGLDSNALSIYKKENNFWADYYVSVPKDGLTLDLSQPEDFIKYKVLLANTDLIAPSVEERVNRPKATYEFELVESSAETKLENAKMDATMASYKEFGKIDNDFDTMRVIVELLDGRPYSQSEKSDFLRSRINQLIQVNPKKFLETVKDPLLHAKVLIRRATELHKLSKRGDFYYLASDGSPLCENGENPTLAVAAQFINLPAHQDIKFILESEVEKNRVQL